jgi:D-glycero-D-manno-heptose 1,7-bisphosphate phosphatase
MDPIFLRHKTPNNNPRSKAVIFDRDATLISFESYFLLETSLFRPVTGVEACLSTLSTLDYRLFIASNQRCIEDGTLSAESAVSKHLDVVRSIDPLGLIEASVLCPHSIATRCVCRKPNPGMIDFLMGEYDLSPAGTWVVGDKISDAISGTAAGVNGAVVGGKRDRWAIWYPDIEQFVEFLKLAGEKRI